MVMPWHILLIVTYFMQWFIKEHVPRPALTLKFLKVVSRREESVLVCIKFMHVLSSGVWGYRVYRDIWEPSVGEKLVAQTEFDNQFNKFVKLLNGKETVSHLPSKCSRICKFTAWCPDVLTDKLHPQFDTKILSKKVQLIQHCLR